MVLPQLRFYRRALPSARGPGEDAITGTTAACSPSNWRTSACRSPPVGDGRKPGAKNTRSAARKSPSATPASTARTAPMASSNRASRPMPSSPITTNRSSNISYMALEHHRFFGTDIRPYLPLDPPTRCGFSTSTTSCGRRCAPAGRWTTNGKLVIFPSTSCESYRGARNPADLIAGLARLPRWPARP